VWRRLGYRDGTLERPRAIPLSGGVINDEALETPGFGFSEASLLFDVAPVFVGTSDACYSLMDQEPGGARVRFCDLSPLAPQQFGQEGRKSLSSGKLRVIISIRPIGIHPLLIQIDGDLQQLSQFPAILFAGTHEADLTGDCYIR
jgi:hypothetical protein